MSLITLFDHVLNNDTDAVNNYLTIHPGGKRAKRLAIVYAAAMGNAEMVEAMLKHGICINTFDVLNNFQRAWESKKLKKFQATMENSILTYALLGSQEAFEAEQSKLQRLSEEAQGELNRELQVAHGKGESAMTTYSQTILTRFGEATAGFEGLDEIGQLKKRQELSDEQYKSIVKGQCLQQLMMHQQQQQGGFGGQ